ncbi:MAG: membrane or secreted protein [Pirellulaceae bacterium]
MSIRPRNLVIVSSILVTLTAVGCNLAGPNFGPQGTFEYQRGQAVLHDPFPNNDAGPAVVGGRPLGYERPLAEPENNQEYRSRGGKAPAYYGF